MPAWGFKKGARERLCGYPWPGNVRELQNTIERAVILSDGEAIDADTLQLPAARPAAGQLPSCTTPENFLWHGTLQKLNRRDLEHVDHFLIENALRECEPHK